MISSPTLLSLAKNLTHEPPRNPDERWGGFVILMRAVDKGRAFLNGTPGEYNFNCPGDQMLFNFKGVKGAELLKRLSAGANDEEVLEWMLSQGRHKTPEEIKAWSDQMEAFSFYFVPEQRGWFVTECNRLGLDPINTTLFEYLEVDDRKRFGLPVPIQDRHP